MRGTGDRDPSEVLAATVVAVAAELRAGRSPADAWRVGAHVPVASDGVPAQWDLLAAVGAPGAGGVRAITPPRGPGPPGTTRPGSARLPRGRPLPAARRRELLRRVHALRAATRLAGELGAPLAGVLEECARSMQADADAETEVRGALAGPQHTARLLTWLPALGLLTGVLLGARPHAVLLDGGAGSLAAGAGVLLTLVGRAWVARTVAAAREPGTGAEGAR
ncbi:hypothetical protein [Cellulomonas sp. C5510]|uniref:hypothetical protein n=1 Tax=Cellulomonas sp. C5510 TaxID=2871170 RepID=UPI0021022232|nr:hypothetical protein [Cellulomonas sp. C5510]